MKILFFLHILYCSNYFDAEYQTITEQQCEADNSTWSHWLIK